MKPKASILSTRPLSQDVLYEAAANDIIVDVISFIETETLPLEIIEQQVKNALPTDGAFVFTSMTAVEAVLSISSVKSVIIYCMGNTTAKLAAAHFGSTAIKGTADSAAALADVIINAGIKEVVFFCGDQRRDELPAKLAANDVAVTEITVYRTIATPQKTEKDYTAILFFSPSAAESFFSENKLSDSTIVFAIGNTTANAIKQFTTNEVIIGDEPGKDALALKAIKYLSHQPGPWIKF